jgi:hypothetical protein
MNPYAMENSIKMRKKEILNRGYSFMTFSNDELSEFTRIIVIKSHPDVYK